MKTKLLFALFLFVFFKISAQHTTIKGKVIDAKTNETLIGCNILIQGTYIGTVTDLDGNYELKNIEPGTYNLVISYISYNQKIERVSIQKNQTINLDITLEPATIDLSEISVIARKRTDTEVSMITEIKNANIIANGISAQQIVKGQDKDAAEVLRRVPGITINDGRFVIVRGLVERYNSVLLNDIIAPSFETDARAFSFDAIPSNFIDNIIIYKSPAPELPADFAGAVIKIITKKTADNNKINISYSTGYVQNTSFTTSYTSDNNIYDYLALGNISRKLPNNYPSKKEMAGLFEFTGTSDEIADKKKQLTNISRSFDKNWNPYQYQPFLNHNFSFNISRRFLIGKISFGNTSALNYSIQNENNKAFVSEYQSYDTIKNEPSNAFLFNDERYYRNTKLNLIHNWIIVFRDNQTIEFKNFLNLIGNDRVIFREGVNNYIPAKLKAIEMKYTQRTIYSGEISGKHKIFNNLTNIDWHIGYNYASKDEPDIKRLEFVKNEDTSSSYYNQYSLRIPFGGPVPYQAGRIFLKTKEKSVLAGFNIEQLINKIKLKTGINYEKKYRHFDARLIGITNASNSIGINLYQPVDSLFQDKNFYFPENRRLPGGFVYKETNNSTDSYNIINELFATFISVNIPIFNKINLYTGLRYEYNNRLLADFQYDKTISPDIVYLKSDLFPSLNISYNITKKQLLRVSYGKTINRPEFREIAPFAYNDFDTYSTIYGDTALQNCYIHDYDIKYELYPSNNEIFSIGLFYKNFINPIERFQIGAGNGWDYFPGNTEYGYSRGIELDIRKSLDDIAGNNIFSRVIRNLTLLMNASFIWSEIETNRGDAREKSRIMYGQSPYIINTAIFYNNDSLKFQVSINYNIIGKRIVSVGNFNNPHTFELPRNLLDLTITKGFGKYIEIKAGIKDLFNEDIVRVQYENPYNDNRQIIQETLRVKSSRIYNIGITFKL
jgi:outer membrane receptor for ferrienterochelin and colicin